MAAKKYIEFGAWVHKDDVSHNYYFRVHISLSFRLFIEKECTFQDVSSRYRFREGCPRLFSYVLVKS